MPRAARTKSSSGIYHIMLRGINQQAIFHDEEDNKKFLKVLTDCKQISEFKLYAYCLMGNHVHLLIKEENEPLDLIFKRIGSRYVYWYNTKYKRVGHLFQDRYKSCAIESDEYFLSALRYIHKNPVKAGVVSDCKEYEYSSYNEYFGKSELIDREFVLEMMSIQQFEDFHNSSDCYKHLEIEPARVRITDEEAQRIIKKLTGCNTVEDYQNLPLEKKKEFITEFRKNHLSIRQISRLTGMEKSLIQRQIN